MLMVVVSIRGSSCNTTAATASRGYLLVLMFAVLGGLTPPVHHRHQLKFFQLP